MLKKQNRLRKTFEIRKVLSFGRSFNHPLVNLKAFFNPKFSDLKFAFIVSTKVSKNAVKRNRLKRIARELVRPLAKNLKKGHYTLIFKPLSGKVSESDILSAVELLIKQSQMFGEKYR